MEDAKKAEIFQEAEEKLNWIRTEKFRQIAEEIKNVEIYQFLKSITWGYQVRMMSTYALAALGPKLFF